MSQLRRGLSVALFLLLLPGVVRGQVGVVHEPELVEQLPSRILLDQPFVGRFDETPYGNFGFENYPRLPEFTSNLAYHYNTMGDPLLYGTQSVNWVERRGLGVQRGYSSQSETGGHGETANAYGNLFGNVIIGTDGTDAWQSKLIYGDEVRSSLTPLTMKLSNMNGLRFDVATEVNNFSAMISTLPWGRQSGQGPGKDGSPNPRVPTMMLATHYQRKIGFLNVGGTFLNIHQYEPLMASRFESLDGVPGAIQTAPAMVALRILDDSPQDGVKGPVLYGVDVYVNGELHPALAPFVARSYRMTVRARGAASPPPLMLSPAASTSRQPTRSMPARVGEMRKLRRTMLACERSAAVPDFSRPLHKLGDTIPRVIHYRHSH